MLGSASGAGHGGADLDSEIGQLIRETKPRSDAKKTVAFLGEAGAGKTVVAALLKRTLSTTWIPSSRNRWDAVTVSGHDEINEIISCMRRGLFPPPAAKDDRPDLKIDMHRMTGAPSKISLVFRDISGESHFERLSRPHTGHIDELLRDLLKTDGSYIAHADAYVLVISCEGADGWKDGESRAADAIAAIHAIKDRMGCLDHGRRLAAPIALVFTKGDTLSPAHAQKSAGDLAGMCHGLASALRTIHSGPLACFKVHATAAGPRPGHGGDALGGRGALRQPHPGTREYASVRHGEGGAGGQAPAARLAVPLSYSHKAYFKLITWLADPQTLMAMEERPIRTTGGACGKKRGAR